jgi:hypothetical protein
LILALTACGGGDKQIRDLPLLWADAKNPTATTAVQKAFAAGAIEIGEFTDGRAGDRAVVGTYEDDGFKVRTNGDVRAFWAGQLRILLEGAGVKFGSPAEARLDARLLEFSCIEGNTFNATVRMAITVTRHEGGQWSKTYTGEGKRWGRTHNPENFDEALSNALAEATRKAVQDEEFAAALVGPPKPAPAKN